MTKRRISGGTAHAMTADFRKALASERSARAAWEDLTPLARNEWICWVTFVKKAETRKEHVERAVRQLKKGKRRPCCWIGCIHRGDKPSSPSARGVLAKRSGRSER